MAFEGRESSRDCVPDVGRAILSGTETSAGGGRKKNTILSLPQSLYSAHKMSNGVGYFRLHELGYRNNATRDVSINNRV